MKLVKSLLLGSAAGLVAVAGAQAADLPVRKAAPVEYVRVCTTYGTGYFYIPGTDTCLRMSGYVQADYLYLEQQRDDFDEIGFRARVRLNLDLRTATEWGLLRGYARLDWRRQSGTFVSRGQGALGAEDLFFGTGPENSLRLDLGYIQFGGLTAGRVQSFYDFWANDGIFTTLFNVSDSKTQALAYTATFGSGFSATIAIEDPQERQTYANIRPGAFGAPFVPVNPLDLPGVPNVPGGTQVPDVVANFRIDQAWGAFQLSGAAHQVRSVNPITVGAGGLPVVGTGPVPFGTVGVSFPDDEWGFAAQAGLQVKLPMIAAGDSLWVQAAWATGALSYTHAQQSTAVRAGTLRLNQTDATVNPFTGDIELTDSWSISANFLHYWLPNLRQNIFASYGEIDYDASATQAFVAPGPGGTPVVVNAGFNDTRIFEIGTNLIWSPVRNLDIGVEAIYRKVETDGLVRREFGGVGFGDNRPGAALVPFTAIDDQDALEARLRIQRDF
ncbi:MAG TPA: porin [Beijerinckiaceae bacterium]|jgi:hypothetical protein